LSESPAPKSRRGKSKKSEIAATQELDEEPLELPVLEEEPAMKGRRGKQSAPAKPMVEEEPYDDLRSKTTRGGKKSTRGARGRGKASIAS
jgi:hypothetical protein